MNSKNKSRLTYIEPNEYAGLFAKRNNSNISNKNELSWNPEDLVMSADLQVIIPRREDAGQVSYMVHVDGNSLKVDDGLYGRYVSYMGGVPYDDSKDSQSFLTDNYTNISYQEVANNTVVDKESLGINSIDINFDAHFFPMITINFTDVRGAALFMLSEEEYQSSLSGDKQFDSASSFFKALFHFPYPRFLLSVKGFYGTKVTFQLAVSNFRSGFKPETGDYDITVQFIGYIYGLYTDLPFNLVMAAPYYNTAYWEQQKASGVFKYVNSDGSPGNDINTYVQFLGKMESKELDSDALNGAEIVKSYTRTLKAIEALKVIPKLYKKACECPVFVNGTTKRYDKTFSTSGVYTFVWGAMTYTSDDKDEVVAENGGFSFQEENTIELYKAIQNIYRNFPEYAGVIEEGNVFLNSFFMKKVNSKKMTSVDITNDNEFKHNKLFSYLRTTDHLSKYFTFYKKGDPIIENGTPSPSLKAKGYYTISNNDKFRNAIDENDDFKDRPLFGVNSDLAEDLPFINNDDEKSHTGKDYCLLINVAEYCNGIDEVVKNLSDELTSIQNTVAEELKIVYKNIIGFEPTVENYYRMLFAHLDCFFDYYTRQILHQVKQDYDKHERTLDKMEISAKETDLPKRFSRVAPNTVSLYPYPAYYTEFGRRKIKIADYPGYATDKGISGIPEVKAVSDILKGLDELHADYERNVASKYSIDVKRIFSPLSILYDFRNPWDGIQLTKTNTEKDILHIIYYYLCLLFADRIIGTNTGKRSKKDDDGKIAYYEQLADLLFDVVGNDLNDVFTNKLKYIISTISQADGVDYVLNGIQNLFGFTEVGSTRITQCLYPIRKDGGKLTLGNRQSHVALKITDDILTTPIDTLVTPTFYEPYPYDGDYCDPDKNTHYIISGGENDCRQRIRAIGNTWFLKDKNSNVLKGYNKSLIDNGDGYEYLYKNKQENLSDALKKKSIGAPGSTQYPGYINLGDYNTNLLLQKPYSTNGINPLIGINSRCDFVFSTEKESYTITDGTTTNTGSVTVANQYVETVDTGGYTYQLLNNFYDEGVTNEYYIHFAGRKCYGLTEGERIQGRTSDGRAYFITPKYDSYTSVNLFSGIKKYVIGGVTLAEYDENVPVEDMHWVFYNSKISGSISFEWTDDMKEDYMGLLYTRRCLGLVEVTSGNNKWYEKPNWYSMSEEEKQKARYAFAAYFLASLAGPGKLQEIVKTAMENMTQKHTCVIRKVDLLYLGASLYFAQNEYNAWSSGTNKNIRDLINGDGTLAYGLVKEDNGKNNNPNIEVQTLLYESGDKIIEYFENWCNSELFGGSNMYNKLSAVAEEDENWEYITYNGYAGYNDAKSTTYSYVQGYAKGSACETWLTNLVYEYEYLITFYCHKDDVAKVEFTKEDITNFLGAFYNLLHAKEQEDEEKRKKAEEGDTTILSQDQKRATYYLLKNLYDKWLCTYTANEFKLGTPQKDLEIREKRFSRSEVVNEYSEYNNFIYIDQFYRDISSTYIMDSDIIADTLKSIYTGTGNMDIYTFMSFMAQKNNLMLIALPVYSNMYSPDNVERIFTPNTFYNMNDAKNPNGVGTTYVIMYTSEVSHKPGDFSEYDYDSDYPNGDLGGGEGPVDLEIFSNTGNQSASDLDYNVTAFGVTYSKQNQMYFKKIDVNMDNPKVTNESIKNTLMLADGGGGGDTSQPIAIGNNIYSIYSNRSYTCTVEMLGCMNIMPLMYFQLNNIPMFRGLYLIISVKHSIRAGNITTVFTGVRVSKYSLPDVTDIMINSNIFKKILQSDAWKGGKDISGGSVGSGKRLEVATALGFNSHPTEKECKARMKTIELTSYPGMSITIHEDLAEQVQNIFKELSELNVQLSSIGGYCYRKINNPNQPNSNILSLHSLGCAIDINPGLNPFVKNSKPMSTGDDTSIGKIRTLNSPIVAVFKKYGWGWGGTYGDYMHFSKADGK